jgi:hypothetical protein
VATFSPASRARTQLAVFPGREYPRHRRPSFSSSPLSPTAAEIRGDSEEQGRAGAEGLQKSGSVDRGGHPTGRGSPSATRRSAVAKRPAPGSQADEALSLWQARHAPPPPLGCPALLFLLSPPLEPRGTRRRQIEDAARPLGMILARGAGSWRAPLPTRLQAHPWGVAGGGGAAFADGLAPTPICPLWSHLLPRGE